MVLRLVLFVAVLAAFDAHLVWMCVEHDYHPARVLAEVLALALAYWLGGSVLDQLGGPGRPTRV